MSITPFRFVQAGDFRLHQPLYGVNTIPAHLTHLFLESAYDAAHHAFDRMLSEQVDFLVLTGDILDPDLAGPRGVIALADELTRIAESGINVYWVSQDIDVARKWPRSVALPDNVHLIARGTTGHILCARDGQPLAQLDISADRAYRSGLAGDGQGNDHELPLFTVGHSADVSELWNESQIDYIAVTGEHLSQTYRSHRPLLCCSGTHQGRCPSETGPHGVSLVNVNDDREIHCQSLETDVLRWRTERIEIVENSSRDDIEFQLYERTDQLLQQDPNRHLFLTWLLAGPGPMPSSGPLDDRETLEELSRWLCEEFRDRTPVVWAVDMQREAVDSVPQNWYEEDTIRGDFLRGIVEYQENDPSNLSLEQMIPDSCSAGRIKTLLSTTDATQRARLLNDSALLGCELLRGPQ